MTEEDIKRFWSKVDRRGDDECWPWTSTIDGEGYGRMSVKNRDRRAHRLALIVAGQSLSGDLVVDHTCRNRQCVNPNHLRVVSRYKNVHENSNAPAHINSLKTHCPKGHPFSGENLVLRVDGSRGCRACRADTLRRLRARRSLERAHDAQR